jgi:hypothetical protein
MGFLRNQLKNFTLRQINQQTQKKKPELQTGPDEFSEGFVRIPLWCSRRLRRKGRDHGFIQHM